MLPAIRSMLMFRLIAIFILAATAGCRPGTDSRASVNVETPHGSLAVEIGITDPTPPEITAVTGKNLAFLKALGADSPLFVSKFVSDASNPTLEDYESSLEAWQRNRSPQFNDQDIVKSVGGYFGNKLVSDFGMEWVSVIDENGTDYAVSSADGRVTVHPFSMVLQRIEGKESDSLQSVYYAVRAILAEKT